MAKKPEKTEHTILIDEGWSVPNENGVGRRTLVQATAWTIPVVATAVATPAFAASLSPTLEFTLPSYTSDSCTPISGVTVRRTTDGSTSDAGTTITVTLTDGYAFADTSTTFSATTDANGQITLPDIVPPVAGGSSNFLATSDTLTATAPVTATAPTVTGHTAGQANPGEAYAGIPAGSEALAAGYILSPDGTLYYRGSVVATGVTSAYGYHTGNNGAAGNYTAYVDATGGHVANQGNTPGLVYSAIPAGSEAVGPGYFLAPNGDLYYGGSVIASGVTSALGYNNVGGSAGNYITYVDEAGGHVANQNGAPGQIYASVPAGSEALTAGYFLAPNGDLYYLDNVIATGVTSALAYNNHGAADNNYVTYVDAAGGHVRNQDAPGQTFGSVPAGSEALAAGYFLAPNGDLYYLNSVRSTGISSAQGYSAVEGGVKGNYVTFVEEPVCS